jgi:SAM-dependent methyltransferase
VNLTDANRIALAATFDSAAPLYESARPGFVAAAVDWVLPDSARRVLDLGAGTGNLTASLVTRGLEVVAVDPSSNMLAVLAAKLPTVRGMVGAAEAIPLPDGAVDAVVVGSAFHWFARPRADAEMARVLRDGGTVGLLWNWRMRSAPLWRIFDDAAGGIDPLGTAHERGTTLARRWFGRTERAEFAHSQTLRAGQLVDLLASRSYVIALPEADRRRLLDRLRAALEAEVGDLDQAIELPYRTEALRAGRGTTQTGL